MFFVTISRHVRATIAYCISLCQRLPVPSKVPVDGRQSFRHGVDVHELGPAVACLDELPVSGINTHGLPHGDHEYAAVVLVAFELHPGR